MKGLFISLIVLSPFVVTGQASLPASWSFTIANYPNGWTTLGTGFYTGSGNTPPSCRFDNTGDWLQIYFAAAAGPVSYFITGNNFSGGTFELMESVNGTMWTTLNSFTTSMPVAPIQFIAQPNAASRYLRFFYTAKLNGNVGIDDVNIATAPAGPQQEINITYASNAVLTGGSCWFSSPVSLTTPVQFTVENSGTVNTLNLASVSISGTNAPDFSVSVFPSSVAAASTGNMVIDFTPSGPGTRVATLMVTNNDADESAYILNLYGAGGGFATEPISAPVNLSFSNVKSYRLKVYWSAASTPPDGYIVLRRDDGPVTDAPADGVAYDVGDAVGASKVAYVGNDLSYWANNIGANSNYHFAVFSWNGPAPYTNYFESSPLSGNVLSSGSMQPSSYYSSISTAAPTFVDDLTALINPHTDNYYSNYGPRMVSLFWSRDTSDGDKVITCVYSGENYIFSEPLQWNVFSREHTYCHSWMPTYPGSAGPEYSDYFNLYPTNQANANAIRSNYPLGEISGTPTFTYLGCSFGLDINGRAVFEPRDDQKGDAARSLFYMATCYNTTTQNWSFPDPISTTILYGQDQNLLKKWHFEDPPDAREIAKNDFIDSLQGNRNPFIDSVNYACYIDFRTMGKIAGPAIPCESSTIGASENYLNVPGLTLWPNPTGGIFTIYCQTKSNESIEIRVLDMNGRTVYAQNANAVPGNNALSLDLCQISSGLYTIQLISSDGVVNGRLFLQ
ncbi:MAG TPA: endonuclease [Bacteroidia bacterium]|nr:endonuclease [Bacteroidia bacterium]